MQKISNKILLTCLILILFTSFSIFSAQMNQQSKVSDQQKEQKHRAEKEYAEFEKIGKGGYVTKLKPDLKGPSNVHGQPVKPKVTANFSKPPITNKWWSSLIWQYQPTNPWGENLFAYPLAFHPFENGVGIGYTQNPVISGRKASKGHNLQDYHFHYIQDLLVSIKGMRSSKTIVEDYSDWTVTALWEDKHLALKATIGSGLPFAYFIATGQVMVNIGDGNIWYNKDGVVGVTVNNKHYGIFGPTGSSWAGKSSLESTLNNKNYFSIAILPDNNMQTLQFYRQHAYAFVTDTNVNWSYDEKTAQLKTTYNLKTVLKENGKDLINKPLVALFKHQWEHTHAEFTPYTYISPRGTMKVIDDAQFTTATVFNGILPALANVAKENTDKYDLKKLYQYVDQIFKQSSQERWPNNDTYWTGKNLNRIAQLIPIADQVKHVAAKNLFIKEVQNKLESWFKGTNNNHFYYDKTWKTIIGYPSSYDANTQLNDHHFHWGYFIMASAILAQYLPGWANDFNGMIELLIKDANNYDRNDTQFPFMRYFDAYNGHGWANGPSLFADGNNEESSSEAMNFAASLILWGSITNNKQLRDFGIYLYTTQKQAINYYWFNIDYDVFPNGFDKPALGILWSNGGSYAIWWDGGAEEIHAINFLPITGSSLYLGDVPGYLAINQEFMMQNGGNNNIWTDINASIKAFHDPQGAIADIETNYNPEGGETKAHTYHWVHNINQLGVPDTSITASIATAVVFEKNGKKTYIAFNPNKEAIKVIFSDGTIIEKIEPLSTKFTVTVKN